MTTTMIKKIEKTINDKTVNDYRDNLTEESDELTEEDEAIYSDIDSNTQDDDDNRPSWQKISIELPEGTINTSQAIIDSGFDLKLDSAPIFIANQVLDDTHMEEFIPYNAYKAIVNLDNHEILGLVSKDFEKISLTSSFELIDEICKPHIKGIRYAGLIDSRYLWLMLELNQIDEIHKNEPIGNHLLLVKDVINSSSFEAYFYSMYKDMIMPLKSVNESLYRVKYSSTGIEAISKMIDDAQNSFDSTIEVFKEFNKIKLTPKEVKLINKILIPANENTGKHSAISRNLMSKIFVDWQNSEHKSLWDYWLAIVDAMNFPETSINNVQITKRIFWGSSITFLRNSLVTFISHFKINLNKGG